METIISTYTLQVYWWLLVSIIGAFFVMMTFVQGGQTLLYTLGKTEIERDLIVNAMGRKWELTFTTLVMFGGALFAAFPLFYSVSFGGAYYLWMAILFFFIIQAVSYEYRKKPNNLFGERFYEWMLFLNGTVGIFLIGVALGTLITGGHFVRNDMNLSHWTTSTYGLEALLHPFNIAFGLMLVFLSRVLGSLYIFYIVEDDTIKTRTLKSLKNNTLIFLPLFLFVAGYLLTRNGYSYNPETGEITSATLQYLHNFLTYPALLAILVIGVLSLLYGIYLALVKQRSNAFWYAALGVVLTVTVILFDLGFNYTVFYPSLSDLQSSLTIQNAAGSHYTLFTMSIVSLLVPIVLGYIYAVWRSMDKTKLTRDEIESDPHHY
jgi:cytochrome d ubiquinol oxidase subunit II